MRKTHRMRRAVWSIAIAAAVIGSSPGAAEQPPAEKPNPEAVGQTMPPRIRALLIQEMTAVLAASQAILDAIVRGEDQQVARHAQAIHDSFILAQQMTGADREALHDSVPHAFLARDQAFHALSADLAQAAREGDKARQRTLFGDMMDACVGCHATHATDRFPGLRGAGAQTP